MSIKEDKDEDIDFTDTPPLFLLSFRTPSCCPQNKRFYFLVQIKH
jgi:hypothetical protein